MSSGNRPGHTGLMLAVMAGGACGALLRSYAAPVIQTALAWYGDFPWGILCLNLCGSFCMGILLGTFARQGRTHPLLHALLGTGLLGGLTTFSAFATDTLRTSSQAPLTALLYVAVSLLLGVCAAGAGYILLTRRPRNTAGAR